MLHLQQWRLPMTCRRVAAATDPAGPMMTAAGEVPLKSPADLVFVYFTDLDLLRKDQLTFVDAPPSGRGLEKAGQVPGRA
jgi:hypothetical protein